MRLADTDFDRRVHFVGVGGAGVSALARLLHGRGVEVSGSDANDGPGLAALRALGIAVWAGSHPERIRGTHGSVVRSAAVSPTDAEVARCEARGFTSLLYAQALGNLTAQHATLAIAGSHGKTSTTALTAAALRAGGVDASHIVGGDTPELGGNGYGGSSDWLVVEACEFNRSFHQLHPRAAAVLNSDHDHFDCYATHEQLLTAFGEFVARVAPGGLVVLPHDPPACIERSIGAGVARRLIGNGPEAEVYPADVDSTLGRYAFTPVILGQRLPRVQLAVTGRFQMHNALYALTLALWAGADPEKACAGVAQFVGVRRRFELRRGPHGGEVVSDYAHHPAEIEAVLAAARQRFPDHRLVLAFQPHQHQRTAALLPEFARALTGADISLVADIYGAREGQEHLRTTAAHLAAAARGLGAACTAAGGLKDLPARIVSHYRRGDVVLMLGAGDIDSVVEDVVAAL